MISTLPTSRSGEGPEQPTQLDAASDDRREHVRRMLRVPARLHGFDRDTTVQLIDICRAGVAFASATPLELGATLALSFELPTSAGSNAVSGTVVYCRLMAQSGLYKIGARLQLMPEETVERIVDFVTAPGTI